MWENIRIKFRKQKITNFNSPISTRFICPTNWDDIECIQIEIIWSFQFWILKQKINNFNSPISTQFVCPTNWDDILYMQIELIWWFQFLNFGHILIAFIGANRISCFCCCALQIGYSRITQKFYWERRQLHKLRKENVENRCAYR